MHTKTLTSMRSIALLIILVSTLLCWPVIDQYFTPGFNLNTFALILIPFIIRIKEKGQVSLRFGYLGLILIGFYWYTQIPLLILLIYFCLIFQVLELFIGKLSNLAWYLIIFLAPITTYFFNIGGFFIRLHLTEWAANTLSFLNFESFHEGNQIIYNGEKFTVAPECMGLNLVRASFLFTLFLMALQERIKGRSINIVFQGLYLLVGLILVVTTNFLRILILVLFSIPADSIWHELSGLLLFVGLVIFPLKNLIKNQSHLNSQTALISKIQENDFIVAGAIIPILIIGIIIGNYYLPVIRENQGASVNKVVFRGYTESLERFNVRKFESDAALVYVKPPVQFYRSDHYPLICWKGSGFQARNEKQVTINNIPIGTATLVRNQETWYTAWWYDNGNSKTASEVEWRINNLTGGNDYSLVNVSSRHKILLHEEIRRLTNSSIID